MNNHPIVNVYTSKTCRPCKTLKAWLTSKHIPFEEYDIDEGKGKKEHQRAVTETGYTSVPLTEVISEFKDGTNLKSWIYGLNYSELRTIFGVPL